MKKILAILLAVLMLLSAGMLASCGGDDKEDEEVTEKVNDGEKEADGEKDSEEEKDDPLFDEDSAQAKLEELGKSDGYEIEFTVVQTDGTESKYLTAQQGDAWWTVTEEGGEKSGYAAIKISDTNVAVYDYDGETWTLTNNMVSDSIDDIVSIYGVTSRVYLFYANSFKDSLESDGTGKIAGRSCEKYNYKEEFLGNSAEVKAYIDKELGITLKWGYEVKAEDEQGSMQMEVTSFKTGKDVNVPDFPEVGEDYQDYTGELGWPDNSFTEMIPKAPGTVQLSMVQDGQFSASMKDVTEDEFNEYVEVLKDAGFEGTLEEKIFSGDDTDGNVILAQFAEGQLIVQLTKAA